MKLKRKAKEFCKKLARRIFEIGQRCGVDVIPHHFYSPLPDLQELNRSMYWKEPYRMTGVNGSSTETQLEFVDECCNGDLIRRQKIEDIFDYGVRENNEQGFGQIEAIFLFCFIFTKRPERIIQIGYGLSTVIILYAAKNAGYKPYITCIDPYPNGFLRKSHDLNDIKLISKKAQLVNEEELTNLGSNGLLFVDSTHTVKPRSEVNRIVLEVLPRLKIGNRVHFHDINFPYGYSPRILRDELFFPNETVLLHASLIDNYKYTLKVSLSMLHYADPEKFRSFFPQNCPSKSDYGMIISEGDFS